MRSPVVTAWTGLVVVAVAAWLTPGLAQADGDDALARVRKSGRLVVAMDPTYPPMETETAEGALSGYDVDFARELAGRLKAHAEFMVMGWDGILGGLVARRYDVIISAMNITPERQASVDFVEYARIAQLFIAKPGMRIADAAALASKVVAVPADTTSADFAEKLVKKGVVLKRLMAFRQAAEVFMAVRSGHAEALIVDEPVGRHYVKLDPTHFAIAGRASEPEPIGVALRKTDASLQTAVRAAVAAMRADGALKRLEQTWFGGVLGGA